MPPAARVLDPTSHGVPLNGAGSEDVLIEGLPAWRAQIDFSPCPLMEGLVPHVGGTVVVGSSSVLINGVPAARQGDSVLESGPPNSIVGGASTVLIG